MGSLLDYSKILSKTKEIKLHIPYTNLGASIAFTKAGFPPEHQVSMCAVIQLQDLDYQSVLKDQSLGFTITKVFHNVTDCTFSIYYNFLNPTTHYLISTACTKYSLFIYLYSNLTPAVIIFYITSGIALWVAPQCVFASEQAEPPKAPNLWNSFQVLPI